mgnify:CR=1 FL=1
MAFNSLLNHLRCKPCMTGRYMMQIFGKAKPIDLGFLGSGTVAVMDE